MTIGDERAQAIRAALDAWNRNYIEDLLYEAEMHSDRMRAADKIEALLNQLRDLLAERDKLVATLEWYADMDNYDTEPAFNSDGMEWCEGAIIRDFGTRARIALGKPKKADLEK